MQSKPRKLNTRLAISATLLGNTLEWYDYATYGFLIPIFSQIFFVSTSTFSALLQSLFIYAIGSISRPIGGIIFGFIGDRWGRKTSLISSILFMTAPVFIIGLLPTYAQIGLAAPLILAFMRFLQGVAAGGEFPVIAVFLVESSPLRSRGFFGSFVFLGVALGILIGGMDYILIDFTFPLKAIYDWGWRIPFFLGTLLGFLTFFLRRKLHETHLYQESRSASEISKDPLKKLFTKYKKPLLVLFGIEVLECIAFNVIVTFLMVYLHHFLHLSFKSALLLNTFLLLLLLIFIPLMGKTANRWGCRTVALSAAIGFLLFSYPLYFLLNQPSLISKGCAIFGLTLLLSSYLAPLPTLFSDLFPTSVRCTGFGMGFNLTIGLIGGNMPLIAFYLIDKFQNPLLPAYCLMIGALFSLPFLIRFKQQRCYLTLPAESEKRF